MQTAPSSTTSAPENPATGARVKVSLRPITFLEGLGVQRVKGVQALPGVWGLLSKEYKQTLGWEQGMYIFPPRSPDTEKGWPHSIQDPRVTHQREQFPRAAEEGIRFLGQGRFLAKESQHKGPPARSPDTRSSES